MHEARQGSETRNGLQSEMLAEHSERVSLTTGGSNAKSDREEKNRRAGYGGWTRTHARYNSLRPPTWRMCRKA
eukprot:1386325-Pleurochrysis_carterae.AAC.3